MKGTRDEDDTLSLNFARYRNHFFDPGNNSGLNARGLAGEPAPDWALEDRQEFATQAFSYRRARQAFLTALTAPTAPDREKALADTFETLGHVIHPLQDMASPPHTRNDPHGGSIFGPTSLYERHLNQPQVLERLDFDGPSVRFGLPRQYWITGDGRGLAEFVNRNFVSEGTNFRVRAEGALGFSSATGVFYPSPILHLGTDEQGRPFGTSLDVQTQLEPGLRDRSGNPIEGSVTFFANNFRDPITGEALRNERMSTLSLFDRELERKGSSLLFALNRYNVEAQAEFLIPRAVGYSAGLLDYFFRGRLDVDLVPADPDDPSVVRLSGTNASADALGGGTLTLHADDPADGLRQEATALDPDLTVTAAKDAPVESARFGVPEGAERFMAVYKGKLGLEEPAGNFPGGVIGKGLGGVRVEEVFSDGSRWKLRTPTGVFLLPLTVAEFEEVRWGDGDSTLVARTPFGPDQPNRVVAYEVQRQAGSVEPLTTDAGGGNEVQLTRRREATFPPRGIPLDRRVEFSQIVQYTQHLVRFDVSSTWQWVPFDPGDPLSGYYQAVSGPDFTPVWVETPVTRTVGFAQTFPVVLDLAHHVSAGWARPYLWDWQEVTVDASGRLLGVALVFLTDPDVAPATVPFLGLNFPAGRLEVTTQVPLLPSFPREVHPLLWAIVDLEAERVVAATADAVIRIATQEVVEGPLNSNYPDLLYFSEGNAVVHGSTIFNGGPRDGVEDNGFGAAFLIKPEGLPPLQLREFETSRGLVGLSVDGWLTKELKEELTRAGFYDFQVESRTSSRDRALGGTCTETSCLGVRLVRSSSEVTRSPARLWEVRRARPAPPAGERLVFLAEGGTGQSTPVAAILLWDAGTSNARVLAPFAEDVPRLGPATGAAVLAVVSFLDGERLLPRASFLFSLEGAQEPVVFPSVDLREEFTLLHPSRLYHVRDLRFYRPRPPLERSALPRKLADLPDRSNPVGDYHAIRLP